jgi:DNA-binding transcriptional ArsR family regulator
MLIWRIVSRGVAGGAERGGRAPYYNSAELRLRPRRARHMAQLDDRSLTRVADYFKALAETPRLKLLNAMRERERNVTELTELLGCSQANVSKHLALLATHGLVERNARGTSVYYRIADPRTYQLCDLVCGQIAERLTEQARTQAPTLSRPARKTRRRS